VEHLVAAARVEVMSERPQARAAIALQQHTDTFQLLPHRILAASEDVHGEILPHVLDLPRIGKRGNASTKDSIDSGLREAKQSGSDMKASTSVLSRLNQSNGVRAGSKAAFRRRMLSATGVF
jgi:hypothetical protein